MLAEPGRCTRWLRRDRPCVGPLNVSARTLIANTDIADNLRRRTRCRNPRGRHPRVRPGMPLNESTAIPSRPGTSGVGPVVPPLFAAILRSAASVHGARWSRDENPAGVVVRGIGAMHRLCNGSLLPGGTGCPSPPTGLVTAVGGAARGASSLAIPIPHHSYRGSLHRSCQVLVPVVASDSSVVPCTIDCQRADCQYENGNAPQLIASELAHLGPKERLSFRGTRQRSGLFRFRFTASNTKPAVK